MAITRETGMWRNSFYGLSTDTKPTTYKTPAGQTEPVPNASIFYEMDTQKVFMFDAAGSRWIEQ